MCWTGIKSDFPRTVLVKTVPGVGTRSKENERRRGKHNIIILYTGRRDKRVWAVRRGRYGAMAYSDTAANRPWLIGYNGDALPGELVSWTGDSSCWTPAIVPLARTLSGGSISPITRLISGCKSTFANGSAVKFFLNAGPEAMNMARISGSSLSYPCVPILKFSLAETHREWSMDTLAFELWRAANVPGARAVPRALATTLLVTTVFGGGRNVRPFSFEVQYRQGTGAEHTPPGYYLF